MIRYVVIDTNVLVSAMLKWRSVPGLVLKHVFDGNLIPVFNDKILKEYQEVLHRERLGRCLYNTTALDCKKAKK